MKLYTVKVFSIERKIVYWTGDVFAESLRQAELKGAIVAAEKVPALGQNVEHDTVLSVARSWEDK